MLGGNFNCDLDFSDPVTRLILDFTKENNLFRCDLAVGCNKVFTYCSDALGNYSCIDFVLMSNLTCLCSYTVKECGSNLSDHLPVIVEFTCDVKHVLSGPSQKAVNSKKQQQYLRWDKADLGKYYCVTGDQLQQLLVYFNDNMSYANVNRDSALVFINNVYSELVKILRKAADNNVPAKAKNFFTSFSGDKN